MRVAALADVHGNLPALEAVLAEVELAHPDLVVFCGDVAAGLLPRETIDALIALDRPARFVRGNCDRIMVEMFDGKREPGDALIDAFCVAQLDRDRRDFLASFEASVVEDGVLYCHATPHDDTSIFTRRTHDERVRELLGTVGERVIVCGHTHMQFDRVVDGTRVVNAGSVGMPYGTTEACWALLEGGDVEPRRTPYDLSAAAERFRASGHHLRDVLIEENVLASPSEDEALDQMDQAAAG